MKNLLTEDSNENPQPPNVITTYRNEIRNFES